MRTPIGAVLAAILTTVLAVTIWTGPAHGVEAATTATDTKKDVVVVKPKVAGNKDVDIFGAYYAVSRGSTGSYGLTIELDLRKVVPARATTQLYTTTFKKGGRLWAVFVNDGGGAEIQFKKGDDWVLSGCDIAVRIGRGTGYIGGDVLIRISSCWEDKSVRILSTRAENYQGLAVASRDRITVRKKITSTS